MNRCLLLTFSLIAVGGIAGCSKKSGEASTPPAKAGQPATGVAGTPAYLAAPQAATNGPAGSTEVLESYGWYVGARTGMPDLALTPTELDTLIKGLRSAAQGEKAPHDLTVVGPKIDEWVRARQTAQLAMLRDKNMAAETAFFAKLKEDKAVLELPSGLRYQVLSPGTGPVPKPTDTVKVHYEGRFIDGTVFDSSIARGEPAEFQLDGVIAGWTEGLQKVSKGGKLKLYVPYKMGYGENGRPGMPPAATLLFDVELLEIVATPAATVPTVK